MDGVRYLTSPALRLRDACAIAADLERRLACAALAVLMLIPTGCLTSRHRPVSPSDPTWVAVRLSSPDARVLLMRGGQPIGPRGTVTRIARGTGKVVGAVVIGAVVVAAVVGFFYLIVITKPTGSFSGFGNGWGGGGGGGGGGSAPSSGDSGGSGPHALDPDLAAFLVSHDADSGDFLDRQRLGAGPDGFLALPLDPGQRAQLDLELDDGVHMLAMPLAIVPAAPRQRLVIAVSAGTDPQPAATPTAPAVSGAPPDR